MLKNIQYTFTSTDVELFINKYNINPDEYKLIYKKSYISQCLAGNTVDELVYTAIKDLRLISANLEIANAKLKRKADLISEINNTITKLLNIKGDLELVIDTLEDDTIQNQLKHKDAIIEQLKNELNKQQEFHIEDNVLQSQL